MKKFIVVSLQVEGFHNWETAPEEHAFLRFRHRHIFHIKVTKEVNHSDRDIEIINFKRRVLEYLFSRYKRSYIAAPCEFGSMSCEMIAEEIMDEFDADIVSVLEDNENGGIVTKE